MTTRTLLPLLAALAALAVASPGAQAAPACGDLSTAQARAAGERFMQRMLGSTQAHRGMDRTMAAMMGGDGMRQAHMMMGRSALGCPAGQIPAGMGQMMDAMGAMAGMMGIGSAYADGMMGGRGSGMMGGQIDHGWDASDTVIVLLFVLFVLLIVAAVAVLVRRGARSPDVPGPTSQPSGST